jgi:hypothetical protein
MTGTPSRRARSPRSPPVVATIRGAPRSTASSYAASVSSVVPE